MSVNQLAQCEIAASRYVSRFPQFSVKTSPEPSPSSRKNTKNKNSFHAPSKRCGRIESMTYEKRDFGPKRGTRLKSANRGLGGGLEQRQKDPVYQVVYKSGLSNTESNSCVPRDLQTALVENAKIRAFCTKAILRAKARVFYTFAFANTRVHAPDRNRDASPHRHRPHHPGRRLWRCPRIPQGPRPVRHKDGAPDRARELRRARAADRGREPDARQAARRRGRDCSGAL